MYTYLSTSLTLKVHELWLQCWKREVFWKHWDQFNRVRLNSKECYMCNLYRSINGKYFCLQSHTLQVQCKRRSRYKKRWMKSGIYKTISHQIRLGKKVRLRMDSWVSGVSGNENEIQRKLSCALLQFIPLTTWKRLLVLLLKQKIY